VYIDGIHIKNFLSFDTFDWTNLDSNLNVIVGPNGTGKTNIFHAIRALQNIFIGNRDRQIFMQQTNKGSANSAFEIALDIRTVEDHEMELWSTFLAASLCSEGFLRSINIHNVPGRDELMRFSRFLLETLHPERVSWLSSGRLTVSFDGLNSWSWRYERGDDPHVFRMEGQLGSIPSLSGSAWITCLGYLPSAQMQYNLHLSSAEEPFRGLLSGGAFNCGVDPPRIAPMPTHQLLQKLTGLTFQGANWVGADIVIQTLLKWSLVITDNIRSKLQYNFDQSSFNEPNIDLSDGGKLALHLFKTKNGTANDQEHYIAIQRMFTKLTGRDFDVSLGNPGQTGINLSISIINDSRVIPLEFSGAGIAEALFLSTLMASGTDRVILLDEPALNLHTTMQKTLLDAVQLRTGKRNQFIIVTHSPTLVPPFAITNVSRFSVQNGATCRAAIDRSSTNSNDILRIEQELRRSTDTRALLFSRGVILVEGETELGLLSIWYQKQFGDALERQDITIREVGSDQNFKPMVKFLRAFNIPWAIVCDGKVIGRHLANQVNTSSGDSIVQQLKDAGIPGVSGINNIDFMQLCRELESYGVFTLAKNPQNEIEALPAIHDHLDEARHHFSKSKVRQAQYIATKYDCPSEVTSLMEKVIKHLEKQGAIAV
jgi:Overcoming lysogenization defect protein-like, TOPRIM domain/AAA ATPase domain/AAA domain